MQTHVDDEKMAVSSPFHVEGKAHDQVVFLYKLIAGVAESSHGTRESLIS
jgi:DNA mismatch repair ATPase MutS